MNAPPASVQRARRALTTVVALVALVVVSITVAPSSVPAQSQPSTPEDPGPETSGDPVDVDALRDMYEELVGAEAELLVQYDLSTLRIAELYTEVAEAQEGLDAAEAALESAEADLASRRADEVEADAAAERARLRVLETEEQVRQFTVESYISEGNADALAEMLEILDGSYSSLVRRGYRRSIDEVQGRVIDDLIAARGAARVAQENASEATDQAEAQRSAVDELRLAAEGAVEEKARLTREASDERDRQALLILDIQSRRVSMEARVVSLDRAADGVAEVLAGFQARDPDWTAGALHFSMPVPCAEIGSEFGMRAHPILNITRLHAGADIGVPTGTPVLASADGIVLVAADRGGYGNTVVIAHGHSLGTVYAHNSRLEVQPGAQVKRGDVIALAGSTGLSTGPHVHFETRLRGVPVNPRNFLLPVEGGTGQPGPEPEVEPDRPGLSTTTTTTLPIGQC